ncbi:radical SAM family heme chaperone HemW [Ruficoccus sp. ZRK36]|uniref:radical SAM family heme chaperone HemW n=1 Tax=Ruficoccus sp. ZRK36 TaxID=2866311 RepID=UPI002105EFE4|nr:radical SAM family heme chaperone HemW [Ruficoccus sp. ZRK36]
MSLQAKPSGPLTPLGLYVHVPFCARACDFCAFYQEAPRRGDIDRYLEGVASEAAAMLTGRPVETIFWGGGTPGLLPAEDLRRLGETLLKQLPGPPREWSVEMAPSAVKPDKAAALREIGVNRISMGVQSFDDALLDKLGRQHRANQIYRAWETLREAGFDNINLDLMFALPGQSREQWLADLNEAIRLAPEHISTYCLTFEEDTALWVKLSEGKLRRDVPQEAELYQLSWETLEAAGYAQYEVSNFARPGHACIHNLNTWKMTEWVGLGPSAASQLGGRRFANVANLDQWLAGIEKGLPARVDEVDLTPSILATDTLIFGLRMNAGVDLAKLEADWPDIDLSAVRPWAQTLVAEGLALLEGNSLRLTPEGRLLADRVGADALELLEE